MNDLTRLAQHLSRLCNTDALPLILSLKTLQRFCALPTRIVTSAKCNEQQLLQEIAVLAGTIEDIFTSFINTRTLLQSYTCINFVF